MPNEELPRASVPAEETLVDDVEPASLIATEPLPSTTEVSDPELEPELPQAEDEESLAYTEQHVREVASIPRRFRYRISVDVRSVYDDNVTLASTRAKRDDIYTAVSPQVTFGWGDLHQREENLISFNYNPTAVLFLENSEFNTLEHVGGLEGQWRVQRAVLGLRLAFSSVQSSNLGIANTTGGFANQTNLDIGGRHRVTTFSLDLTGAAPIAGKTSLRLGAHYSLTEPEGFISSQTLSTTAGVNYQYSGKLGIGVDATAGKYLVEDPSPDQTFQQINVRTDYEITGKLRATGSAGVEFRQSEQADHNQTSPIFQFGVGYVPFDGTQFDVSATRRTLNSASAAGQDFTSTQVVFTARQRVLQRIFFTLSTGYQEQQYFSAFSGIALDRRDNYYFIAPGFDVRITSFWFAGAFYTHRRNDSSFDFFSFESNQYGVRSFVRF